MSTRRLPGYRGPLQTPDAGSPLRAAYDAMHANWCGHDCSPGCRSWDPDPEGLQAAIIAWLDATEVAAARRPLWGPTSA